MFNFFKQLKIYILLPKFYFEKNVIEIINIDDIWEQFNGGFDPREFHLC